MALGKRGLKVGVSQVVRSLTGYTRPCFAGSGDAPRGAQPSRSFGERR
jgi:hypothetical protein